MKHEKSRIGWFIGILLSGLLISIGFAVEEYTSLVKILGFIILGLSYIQAFVFCRCPYCSHSFLTISGMGFRLMIDMPKYCPECGKEVN